LFTKCIKDLRIPFMDYVFCSNCHRPYPSDMLPYRCPTCTGIYDLPVLPAYNSPSIDPVQPGIWRYRHTFGLPENAPVVTLGEGNTPVVWAELFGGKVAFKLEFINPSGSYKDRGSAVLMSFLKSRNVLAAVEDSSGNAGASFAAYAGRMGMRATIFVPGSTSGPKCRQIEAYGAEIKHVQGSRKNAADAALQAADQGAVYASHAFLPHGLAGYATLAYELYEQLGSAPGTVVVPVGQGNLLLAIGRGFKALHTAGLVTEMPRLVGVQASACAPLWAMFTYGGAGMSSQLLFHLVAEGDTLAEGVRVAHPIRGDAVLSLLSSQNGLMLAVDEADILPGRDALARLGLYVEPTSAIVWSALRQNLDQMPEPVVVVLTGSGLKTY
jgi:threonine synthase